MNNGVALIDDNVVANCITFVLYNLKEYYEIVGESRPLSVFFPTHADLFTEMHFYS